MIKILPANEDIAVQGDDIIIGEGSMLELGFEKVFDKFCKIAMQRDQEEAERRIKDKQTAQFLLEGK